MKSVSLSVWKTILFRIMSSKVKGTWESSISTKGEYVRKDSIFRNFVTADGSSGFKAEPNRYHLYVSLACPWAHRALIFRGLKGLEDVISYTVVDWFLDSSTGWRFTDKTMLLETLIKDLIHRKIFLRPSVALLELLSVYYSDINKAVKDHLKANLQEPKCTLDTVNNCSFLREVYEKVTSDFGGRVTVPVLWDKQKSTIVNNESSEVIRMLNTEFNDLCKTEEQRKMDFYPENLRSEIDALNVWIYPQINNGVYRSGFARSQEAYETAVNEVFDGLDKVEEILSKNRYLVGGKITEADIRLFTTLVRFDPVYVGHFKCNKKRIIDYPNIWGYTKELYQIPAIKETVDMMHIKKHYLMSHTSINPHRIVPVGPVINFDEPHNRDHLPKA